MFLGRKTQLDFEYYDGGQIFTYGVHAKGGVEFSIPHADTMCRDPKLKELTKNPAWLFIGENSSTKY